MTDTAAREKLHDILRREGDLDGREYHIAEAILSAFPHLGAPTEDVVEAHMSDDELLALARSAGSWNVYDQRRWAELTTTAAIIALIERHRAEVERLTERVGFIEHKPPYELGKHGVWYCWALEELTARRAYDKSEVATLIAEQVERAEAAESALAAVRAEQRACKASAIAGPKEIDNAKG